MNRNRLGSVKAAAVLVIAASLLTLVYGKPPAQSKIVVSNAREFLAALGSNRIVELKPGTYNLSDADPYNADPYHPLIAASKLQLPEGVSWREVSGQGELVLSGITNLTIRNAEPKGGKSPRIIIDPRESEVMTFVGCSGITIEGLVFGHSEKPDGCTGGVLFFEKSSQITISNTGMFGSGIRGLYLSDVSDVKVVNSSIYECTYDIMNIHNSKNISFEECRFYDNDGNGVVVSGNSQNIFISNSEFKNNDFAQMFYVYNNATVSVSRSRFIGNKTGAPIDSGDGVKFSNCVFDKDGAKPASKKGGEQPKIKIPSYYDLMQYTKLDPKAGKYGANNASGVNIWGWSSTGNAAFSFDHGGGCCRGGFVSAFFIMSMISDKFVYELFLDSEKLGIKEETANAMTTDEIYALKIDDIKKAMSANGIVERKVDFSPFPLEIADGSEYKCSIKQIKKENGKITGYDIVVSKDGKEKKIKTVIDAFLDEVFVCGYFMSPFERKILVVVAGNSRFKGNNFIFQFSGCDLDKGFK